MQEIAADQLELHDDPEAKAKRMGTTVAVIRGASDRIFSGARWFSNPTYLVSLQPAQEPPGWLHLRIQRHDGTAPNSWPDMQRLKNELVGCENEGVELFPAESRLLHVGHVRHLWINADSDDRLEIGLHTGRAVDDAVASA
jgi:hypothetical protein